MKYTLKFFTHTQGEEQLVKTYKFDYLPYIPRKKDLIQIDWDQYLVRRVSVDYKNNLFEIMLDIPDFEKEWWE